MSNRLRSLRSDSVCLASRLALYCLTVNLLVLHQSSLLAQNQVDEREQTSAFQIKQLNGIGFRFPASLELELVAAPPLVKWPIVAEWDPQGRMVIVESAGVQGNVAEQTKTRPHRMIRLVDVDQDGVFDRRIVAAEDLGFPEGVLCIGNQVLVSTPPQILSLIDRDGDGVCEERSVWFDGTTLTGCANDLHGPYMGRDGWIYWCKGAFAEQKHELTTGKQLVSKAAHVFRRRLEGGAIEPVMTGGMDNPVELAITPEGERFFTSTFLQHPAGGRRDGIAHAVYGGVYGKDHPAVLNGHVRTGPLMPIMTHLGPAAPSGLITLSGPDLATDSGLFDLPGNTLAAAQFNLQRVSLHQLQEEGATFKTIDRDLLLGDQIDFHPTDILEDADGSLLVIDTGGWYDLCCPSSGVDQDRAQGGIYRLKGKSSKSLVLPRGKVGRDGKAETETTIDSNYSLAQRLQMLQDTSRWWTRREASIALSSMADAAPGLKALMANQDLPYMVRVESLWTLCKLGGTSLKDAVAVALNDRDQRLRQAALHVASVHRLPMTSELEKLVELDPSPQVRRTAAEALGRIGGKSSIGPLMEAIENDGDDVFLSHSLLYAMIELNQTQEVATYLDSKSARKQWATIVVLDQSKSPLLKAPEVFARTSASDPQLRSIAIDALIHHPEWATELRDSLDRLSTASINNPTQRTSWLAIVASWRDRSEVRELIGKLIREADGKSGEKETLVLESLQSLKEKELATEWSIPIFEWISRSPLSQQLGIAKWLATLSLKPAQHNKLIEKLKELAHLHETDLLTSFQFLGALPEGTVGISNVSQANLVRALTDPRVEDSIRTLASKGLQRIRLDATVSQQLLDNLHLVEPLHLLTAITAISRLREDVMDERLFESLKSVPSVRTLPPDAITSLYRNRNEKLKDAAKKVVDQINQPPIEITEKLNKIETELPVGDATRGFQVFRSAKAACSACHRIGYVGGNIGPELSRIGASRTRRDLLEAILFPSVRLAQSYQPIKVLTHDGQVYNGLVRSEDASEIEIVVAADRVVRVAKSDIESRQNSNVSIMPAGLDQTMSKQDLADLMMLLESKK